jgi:hypothetical protein
VAKAKVGQIVPAAVVEITKGISDK